MQGSLTPNKQIPKGDEPYTAIMNSGKQILRVNIGVFSTNRNERPPMRNISQFVNIMPETHSQPQAQNPEKHVEIMEELAKYSARCESKMVYHQLQDNSPAAKRVLELMARLKDQKIERQWKQYELINLRKGNMKVNRKLEQLKERTSGQVEEMRMMVKRQERDMYENNRYLYGKEKEKLQLAQEAFQISANEREIKEEIKVKEKKIEQFLEEERKIDVDYQIIKANYEQVSLKNSEYQLYVSILKMQVNPYMRVHFESLNSSYSAKKMILEKNPNLWQKKNKILSKEEIKSFLLFQLYPSWRRLLDRLPHTFDGYRQLFFLQGQSNFDSKLQDAQGYIFQNAKQIKYKSSIVFYSLRADAYTQMKEYLMQLIGSNNGIIEVTDIAFDKTAKENIELVCFNYTFEGEKRMKPFELVNLKQLTREALFPYYISQGQPKSEKTSLIKIEIPFSFETSSDRSKLEEVYRLFEREK